MVWGSHNAAVDESAGPEVLGNHDRGLRVTSWAAEPPARRQALSTARDPPLGALLRP